MLNGIAARMHAPMGFGFRERWPASRAESGSATPGTTATSVAAQSHLATELTVVTREGDTITLDWSRDASATYTRATTNVDRDGDGDVDASTTVTSLERSVKSAFSIEVQGDLSEQEQADLRQILRAVKHALRDFARGDAEGAAEDIANARTSGSLASVQADFEASFSVTATRLEATASVEPPKLPMEPVPVGPAPVETAEDTGPTTPAAPVIEATAPTEGGTDAATEVAERLRRANEDLRAWLANGRTTDTFGTVRAPAAELATATA